jgi:hypothetical protein
MGLDTSHGCWNGPYSAFDRWRTALQEAAGWHLEEEFLAREVNWEAVTDDNIAGRWDALPEDPLVVLVAHSDCDGEIPVEALLPLAERLEGLADRFPDDEGRTPRARPEGWPEGEPWPPRRGAYDGYREATLRFAAGLREAAAAGEPVEFG